MTVKIKEKLTADKPSIVGAAVLKDLGDYSFRGMKLGDTFYTKGLLSGVTPTPQVWRLVETNFAMTDLIFDVTYFGVFVGQRRVNPAQNNRVIEL